MTDLERQYFEQFASLDPDEEWIPPNHDYVTCPTCHGVRVLLDHTEIPSLPKMTACPTCRGVGTVHHSKVHDA